MLSGFQAGTHLYPYSARVAGSRVSAEGRGDPHRRLASRKQKASRVFPVPRIKKGWFADRLGLKPELDIACREVIDHPASDFSQAIESLYTFGVRTKAKDMAKILFVSEQDGLGVTTVAVNFAQVAAMAGERVLLIEANRRNPVAASLMSPSVNSDLIDLMGTKRIICHVRQGLSIIPLLDEAAADVLAARATRCIEGIGRHFDLAIIDGGTLDHEDDEMREMADAVNSVFHLTPEGIEIKAGINSFKTKR